MLTEISSPEKMQYESDKGVDKAMREGREVPIAPSIALLTPFGSG
jgi:hypothetical protein